MILALVSTELPRNLKKKYK